MGTSYSVLITQLPDGITLDSLQPEIDSILVQINRQMSTYDENSELSTINQSSDRHWLTLSPELFKVVSYALWLSQQTDGAFDVTVGPLVNLWGFGPPKLDDPQSFVNLKPTEQQIANAKKQVGFHQLTIKQQTRQLRKPFSDLYIDLSAIAKGYAVDQLAAYLDSMGIQDYLVEIGGELKGKGLSPRGDFWRVALEKPEPGKRTVQRVIEIANIAVATSGDYRNYFEKDGIRYSHTIDPRSGQPINHKLASVSVLAEQAMIADAWATALMVLGEEAGFKLAEDKGLAAYFLYRQENAFHSKETSAFTQLTRNSG